MDVADKLSPFYVHNYYPILSSILPKTEFIPITIQEQELILLFQNSKYKTHLPLSSQNLMILESLTKKLDQALTNFSSSQGVFIKLNFRSGKDGFPLNSNLFCRGI